MSGDLKVFGKTYTGVTGIQAKDIDGLNVLFSSDWYDIDSGNLTAIFEHYANKNNMIIMDITFASNQESNVSIQHTLGHVPEEVLFYPKNPNWSGVSGYQAGYMIDGYTGADNARNRTITLGANYDGAKYSNRQDLISFIASIVRTDYFLVPSAPTDTEIVLRGGTNGSNRLIAGEYKLALR